MRSKFKWIFTLLLAFTMQFSFAQEKTIAGVVSDASGPLPGVNVVVKGTQRGVSTGFDGGYSIKAKEGETLVFSFLGLNDVTRVVGSATTVNVSMQEDTKALETVVVVAYGKQKKEALTGSVTEVKAKELQTIQNSNVIQGLTGKVAGVQIINNNGQPGSEPVVRFRGIGSINSSNQPLYVVDGTPFLGNVNTISNLDFESVTVLKDASAAALYGSRGANGVILITTKKGKKEKFSVTLDVKTGINSRAVKEYDIMSSPSEYYEAYYQFLKNDLMSNQGLSDSQASTYAAGNMINYTSDYGTGLGAFTQTLNYNNYNVPADQVINPSTGKVNPNARLLYNESWDDALFKQRSFTQTYLSVSGGGENSNSFFSLGYDTNDGYAINSGFERITAKISNDVNVAKWLKIGSNINYSHTLQKRLDGGDGSTAYSNPFGWTRNIAPIYPVYAYDAAGTPVYVNGVRAYDDGTGTANGGIVRPYGDLQNPVATALLDRKRNKTDNIFGNFYLDLELIKDLKFKYNIAGDLRYTTDVDFDTPLYGDAVGANGRTSPDASHSINFTQQQLLNYTKKFGQHSFELLVGHETTDWDFTYLNVQKQDILLPQGYVGEFAGILSGSSNYERNYNLEGFLGRLLYSYNDKYFVNLNARRDGSSVFHPDNRWGNFYGVGAAWRIGQENFLKNASWLSELKLKGSFGQQGNDALLYPGYGPYAGERNYYNYQDQYQVTATPVGGSGPGISPVYFGNKNLKWETNTNLNAGFELGLFDNRFKLNAEYFERKVSDMLYHKNLAPSVSGLPSVPENIGSMENKGYELTISADVVRNENLTVNIGANATHFKNEVTELYEGIPYDDGSFRIEEGYSRYSYFMREFVGVNPATGAAQWYSNVNPTTGLAEEGAKYVTENFAQATRYRIDKDASPDVYGGFNASVAYKGFDLALDFAYQFGGYGIDGSYWNLFSSEVGGNYHRDALTKTWTPNNTTASLPRVDIEDPNNHYATSTMFLTKSDYVSLQNVSLGYSFSKSITDKLGLNGLRIYALANNVALWSKRQGYDPRLSLTGNSANEYALFRTVSAGLNINF